MQPFSVRVHLDFGAVRDEWRALEESAHGFIFQHVDWLETWYREIGKGRIQPCLVLATGGSGAWRLALPLGIERRGPVRVLTCLGGSVTDYQAPLLLGESAELSAEVVSALWSQIREQLPPFDVAHLVRQPEQLGEDTPNPWLLLGAWPRGWAFHAALTGSWETFYEAQVKGRLRADSRRQRKRLSEIGAVDVLTATNADQVRTLTEHMIRQKRRRLREMGQKDPLADPAQQAFYYALGQALLDGGGLHLTALRCGETIIATHWGAVDRHRFYFLMPTFEGGDWQRYSAGRLLLEHLLEWACSRGLRTFDFTVGGEAYKQDWCNREMRLFEWIEPSTFRGRLYAWWNRFRRLVREHEALHRLSLRARALLSSGRT